MPSFFLQPELFDTYIALSPSLWWNGEELVRRAPERLAVWQGRRIVIKCARPGTTSVGVTYRMLSYLDTIVAAFERPDGQYDLYELTPRLYESLMAPTRSRGASAGKVGIVSREAIRGAGKPIGVVRVV